MQLVKRPRGRPRTHYPVVQPGTRKRGRPRSIEPVVRVSVTIPQTTLRKAKQIHSLQRRSGATGRSQTFSAMVERALKKEVGLFEERYDIELLEDMSQSFLEHRIRKVEEEIRRTGGRKAASRDHFQVRTKTPGGRGKVY